MESSSPVSDPSSSPSSGGSGNDNGAGGRWSVTPALILLGALGGALVVL